MKRPLLAAALTALIYGGAVHAQLSSSSTSKFYMPQIHADLTACYANRCPEQKYSYANATVRVGDTEHHFSCHNTTSGVVIDSIVHFARPADGGPFVHEAKSVLGNHSGTNGSPNYNAEFGDAGVVVTPNAWDGYHLCDPSVVRGASRLPDGSLARGFHLDGQPYAYALFFLGTDAWSSHNQVGVAFANELRGPWKKVPFAIVTHGTSSREEGKNCPARPVASNVKWDWGVGQPSATSVDGGKVLLFYTVGVFRLHDGGVPTASTEPDDGYSDTHSRVAYLDLGNVWSDNPASVVTTFDKPLPVAGLKNHDGTPDIVLNNFDVAYNPTIGVPNDDPTEDRFYVAREQRNQQGGIASSIEVVSLSGADVWGDCDANQKPTGTWRYEATVDATLTGQSTITHLTQPAIERNEWGQFYNRARPRFLYISETFQFDVAEDWRDLFRNESWATAGCLPDLPCAP
jgi:hypothetical protein